MKIICVLLFLFFFFNLLSAAQTLPSQGEINANNINVRSDSTVSASVICFLNKGERVEIISELFGWYKIRLPKNAAVYVKKNLFACIKFAENQKKCLSAQAIKSSINVRLGPNESSAILGKIENNEVINVISDRGDWYKIEPVEKSFGWVHKKFVTTITAAKPASEKVTLKSNPSEANLMLEGTVQPYGRILGRKGTHKLINQDKKIFLLKGNKASLNALNYRRIKVSGSIIGISQEGYPVIQINKIEAVN